MKKRISVAGNLSRRELKELTARGWTPMLDKELRIEGLRHDASGAYAYILTQEGAGGSPAGNYLAAWDLRMPNGGLLTLPKGNGYCEYIRAEDACVDLERNLRLIENSWYAGGGRWGAEPT